MAYANIWMLIGFVGIGLILLPLLGKLDMMKIGYFLQFIGFSIFLIALLTHKIYSVRARVMDDIINERELLLKWKLDEKLHLDNRKRIEYYKKNNMGASFILAGIFVIIGLLVHFTDQEQNGIFLVMMLVIAAVFLSVGKLTAHMQQGMNTGDRFVTAVKNGLCYHKSLYVWDGIVNRLEGVFIHPEDSHKLILVYRQLIGRHHFKGRYVIEIPIPDGLEAEAEGYVIRIGLEADQSMLDFVKSIQEEE